MSDLRPRSDLRSTLAVVAVLVLLGSCGGGGGGRPADDGAGPPKTPASVTTPSGPRSAPRWETVATFEGEAPTTTGRFVILPTAIQWRVRWRCETGRVRISAVPSLKKPLLVTSSCPEEGVAFAIQTGGRRLEVDASRRWKVTVDQQVDTPINEPPLPEMASARVLRSGEFYDVEKEGRGSARLYELPDGRRALRLEGFEVSQNTDLFVWLSEAASPSTSAEVVAAPYIEISNLRSTLGSQNYLVPPDVATEKIRSVVIWCEPIRIAYAAATMNVP